VRRRVAANDPPVDDRHRTDRRRAADTWTGSRPGSRSACPKGEKGADEGREHTCPWTSHAAYNDAPPRSDTAGSDKIPRVDRPLLIGGEPVETGAWDEVRSPYSGAETICEGPLHAVRELTEQRLVVLAV
jgi:hypothetical protein